MLEIVVQQIGEYKDVTINTDTTDIYLGTFNKEEAAKLAYIFETASDEMIE